MKKFACVLMLALTVTVVSAADVAGWDAYVIRNSDAGSIAPVISDHTSGGKVFEIALGGQKAGWGTNLLNGQTVGDIAAISIDRDSSVVGTGPYMNIWISDGQGGYATLSNEPSHPWEYGATTPYDTTWDVMQNATVWVYEVSSSAGFKLPNGTTIYSNIPAGSANPFTFGDFADYLISAPTVSWGGSGAADDLNAATYTAYGINWIFGDTQSNYLGGYLVSNPSVIPEPATMLLLGLGGLLCRRFKK